MDTATPKDILASQQYTGLRSAAFDDLYFSAQDGLAETIHVFLNGNHLPERWKDKNTFVIAETGFGTGLNFLAVWKLFSEHSTPEQRLHFISFEKFPLDRNLIYSTLKPLLPADNKIYLERLVSVYPENPQGTQRFTFDKAVSLTVIFEDVNTAIPTLNTPVDAWFLDGFKPATNPDMWSDTLFTHMARLSRSGTTLATFTAAGFVRRGLETAGFTIHKTKGFGHKRHMTTGALS